MLSPFECLCGNFILPEPASYVFFYALFNLRKLLYIIAWKQEIEECHQALSEVLGKPERRLVLQIIDAKDRIAEDISIDSFVSGFELAWKLSIELNHYENERSVSCRTAMGLGARFASAKEEEE